MALWNCSWCANWFSLENFNNRDAFVHNLKFASAYCHVTEDLKVQVLSFIFFISFIWTRALWVFGETNLANFPCLFLFSLRFRLFKVKRLAILISFFILLRTKFCMYVPSNILNFPLKRLFWSFFFSLFFLFLDENRTLCNSKYDSFLSFLSNFLLIMRCLM